LALNASGSNRNANSQETEAMLAHLLKPRNKSLPVFSSTLSLIFLIALAGLSCKPNNSLKSEKDAIISDVTNIAAFAYIYRIRPAGAKGGNGSYQGLELPEKMQASENATYRVQVVSPDTVLIVGRLKRDTANTVSVYRDGNGRAFGWNYTGDFR
jgi:hypothetical protein